MTRTSRRLISAAAAVVAIGASFGTFTSRASPGVSSATIASDSMTSKRHLASFTGTAVYDSDLGKLTITVNNTAGRGYLTGLGFDAAGGGASHYEDGDNLSTRHDEDAFDQLRMKHGVAKLKPFGNYHAGAALDGKWNAGRAKRGVGAGASHTFTFDVTGARRGSVVDLLGSGPLALVGNFKGVKHGKGDAVGARLTLVSGTSPESDTNGGGDTTVPTDNTNGDPTGNDGHPTTGGEGSGLPPINIPGGNGNGGGPHAVPLPPAAWTGLATMALAAGAYVGRRRLAAPPSPDRLTTGASTARLQQRLIARPPRPPIRRIGGLISCAARPGRPRRDREPSQFASFAYFAELRGRIPLRMHARTEIRGPAPLRRRASHRFRCLGGSSRSDSFEGPRANVSPGRPPAGRHCPWEPTALLNPSVTTTVTAAVTATASTS